MRGMLKVAILQEVKNRPSSVAGGMEIIPNPNFDNADFWQLSEGGFIANGEMFVPRVNGYIVTLNPEDLLTPILPDTNYVLNIAVRAGSIPFNLWSVSWEMYTTESLYLAVGLNQLNFTTPSRIGIGGLMFYFLYKDDIFIEKISLMLA